MGRSSRRPAGSFSVPSGVGVVGSPTLVGASGGSGSSPGSLSFPSSPGSSAPVSGSSGPAPTQTDNVNTTNRVGVGNDLISLGTTNTARREHFASPQGTITNLRPTFYWGYLSNTGTISGAAAARMTHSLEYPEGVIHPTTWAGGAVDQVTAASTTYKADVVLSSVTGLPLEIPAGAKFWERTCFISTSSRNFPQLSHTVAVSTLGITDGKVAGDSTLSGTIPADTSSTVSWGMAALMGTVMVGNAKSVISIGDSLDFGQGDITNVGGNSSSGMIARKIDPLYPHMRIARGGIEAQQYVAIVGGVAFPNFISQLGGTHLVVECGLNDLSQSSRTAAQVMADRQTIIDAFTTRIAGIVPVHTTITPRTNSTSGNYTSVADQTPKTDGNMADLTPLNTLIRAKPLVMDYADAAMSARDSNVFSGPFPPVLDGTHLTSAKAAAVATAVNMPF